MFRPPHAKSWLTGKDSDAGRDWGQEEKGTTEDEMAGWHHWRDGCESEWTPGVGDGQGGLACCDSWGHKESDTTERLDWTELRPLIFDEIIDMVRFTSFTLLLVFFLSYLCFICFLSCLLLDWIFFMVAFLSPLLAYELEFFLLF